jgi:large subunit ribosomal protein L22
MAQSGTAIAAKRTTRKGATINKTNERPGTRAQVRYVRVSAYKAREVLDLIRGKHVTDADEILGLVERDIAIIIRKCLASAVANAVNNDDQDGEALFVSACYADEGPTLKRWRPRARGRATRIRKRTCHITIIVSRLPADKLELRRKRMEAVSANRSRRVDASRRRADLSGRLSRRRAAQATAEAEKAAAADADEDDDDITDQALAETAAPEAVDAGVNEDEDVEDSAADAEPADE